MRTAGRSEAIHCAAVIRRAVLLGLVAAALGGPAAVARAGIPDPPTGSLEGSPGFLDRTSWVILGTLGLASVATSDFDGFDRLELALDRADPGFLLDAGDRVGEGSTMIAASLGLLAAGKLTGSPRTAAMGTDLAASMLVTWGAVWALKLSVGSERPHGGPYSFPSGHTATAFAAAPVVASHLGRFPGMLAYGVASLTALARMEEGKHYPADVLAGAAIGTVVGREVVRRHRIQWWIGPSGISASVGF